MALDLAIAQLRPVKADLDANLARVGELFARIDGLDPRPRTLLLPEAALTGYDLRGAVADHALSADELVAALRARYVEATGGQAPLEIGIGFFERAPGRLHNSALWAELGGDRPRILHLHRKVFLPTYGPFEESRFLAPGDGFRAFDTSWGRAAVLVCEDAWHSLSGSLAALDGADLLHVAGAGPAYGIAPGSGAGEGIPGSLDRWDRLLRGVAEEHGVFVAFAQMVGFEGSTGFAGGSALYGPGGERLARAELWEEELLTVRIDPDRRPVSRERSPLLADLRAALPRILAGSPAARDALAVDPDAGEEAADLEGSGEHERGESGDGTAGPAEAGDPGVSAETSSPSRIASRPAASFPPPAGSPDPDDASVLEIDPEVVTRWLVEFLRREVRDGRGFETVVLGLSGGVDSSVAAAICARALGPENVLGYALPGPGSSEESEELAAEVAHQLDVDLRTIEVASAAEAYLEAHEPDADPLRRGNVTARQRMIVLFDQSAKHDALPVGTSNKSERLLGYFTWHGDDASPIQPLGDLFKTQVLRLARWLELPEAVIHRPPTAELEGAGTDEEALGVTYAEADLVLYHLLRGASAEDLVAAGFGAETVRRVHERFHAYRFKRHPATIPTLSDTAPGAWHLRSVDYRPPLS
jgi:NAD+ synthetase